jgi:glycosyltransferase involved in cell wall biosynthesis
MNISCCMIVRDEEPFISDTLKNAREYFDEILVVDTGSVDSTMRLAEEFADKVYSYEWRNDFAAARNYGIEKAQNDWIFILDADEHISKFNLDSIKDLMSQENCIGRIKCRNKMNNGQIYLERIKRIFNRKRYHYKGIIHEQIVPTYNSYENVKDIDLIIDHIGYLEEAIERTNKIDRNIKLLTEAVKSDPQDVYLLYQLGKSFSLKKDHKNAKICYEQAIAYNRNKYLYEYIEDLIESYGYTLINLGLYKEALKLEEYSFIYGKRPDYCFLMGLIYMNNGVFNKSVEWFSKCIGEKEGNIEGINSFLPSYNIGVIYECLGDRSNAINWYSKCGSYYMAQDRLVHIGGNANEN